MDWCNQTGLGFYTPTMLQDAADRENIAVLYFQNPFLSRQERDGAAKGEQYPTGHIQFVIIW
jgi:hypothetical protein